METPATDRIRNWDVSNRCFSQDRGIQGQPLVSWWTWAQLWKCRLQLPEPQGELGVADALIVVTTERLEDLVPRLTCTAQQLTELLSSPPGESPVKFALADTTITVRIDQFEQSVGRRHLRITGP